MATITSGFLDHPVFPLVSEVAGQMGVRAFVIGGFVRDCFLGRPTDDIDIVVEVEKPTLSLMYELREKLKALFSCNVDLVRFRSTLRPRFKSNILNDVVYV